MSEPQDQPIDFESDEPLACPLNRGDDEEACESCQ